METKKAKVYLDAESEEHILNSLIKRIDGVRSYSVKESDPYEVEIYLVDSYNDIEPYQKLSKMFDAHTGVKSYKIEYVEVIEG